MYFIVYRYLYSASHSISQKAALFSAFQFQEKGKTKARETKKEEEKE